jgi:hypothetical protein
MLPKKRPLGWRWLVTEITTAVGGIIAVVLLGVEGTARALPVVVGVLLVMAIVAAYVDRERQRSTQLRSQAGDEQSSGPDEHEWAMGARNPQMSSADREQNNPADRHPGHKNSNTD